jgi:type II secretory pathway component PulC
MLTIKTSLAVILMTLSVFVSSAVTYLVMHSSALAVSPPNTLPSSTRRP